MKVDERLVARISQLLAAAGQLQVGSSPHDQVRSESHRQECAGWLVAAQNVVHLLCPDALSAYRVRFDKLLEHGVNYTAHNQVGEGAAVMRSLAKDVDDGLVATISDSARAEVFDDFLDHADEYHKAGRKNESGVIAGVVFEDSIRRAHQRFIGAEKGVQLDAVITALEKASKLTAAKAKRARAAAHVRAKATHAQWDEFDLDDVKSAIAFSREFITGVLDT